MADKEEQLEIELVLEGETKAQEPEVEIVEENQPLPQEKTVDEGLEELKQQLENENNQRTSAQRKCPMCPPSSKPVALRAWT